MNLCPFVPRGHSAPWGLSRSPGTRDEPTAALVLLLPWFVSFGRHYLPMNDTFGKGWWRHVVRVDFSRYIAGYGVSVRFGHQPIRVVEEARAW